MTTDTRDAHSATELVEQYMLLLEERDAKIASLTAQLARCREDTVEECAKVADAFYEQCDEKSEGSDWTIKIFAEGDMHANRAEAARVVAERIRALAPTTGDGR